MTVDNKVTSDDRLNIERNDEGYSRAIAAFAVAEGGVVAPFTARETLDHPTYLTVQTAPGTHILLAPEYLQYINHSCDPNVFFDTDRMEIRALRAIAPGDEVTFFYPSTEWSMDRAFECHCGAAGCLGQIAGADSLDAAVLVRYRFNRHILDRLGERAQAEPA